MGRVVGEECDLMGEKYIEPGMGLGVMCTRGVEKEEYVVARSCLQKNLGV
jgi:hypothetical protein